MLKLLSKFIKNKEKTNIHVLLCIKDCIYANEYIKVDHQITSNELLHSWKKNIQLNPTLLNSQFFIDYFFRQKYLIKNGEFLEIHKNYKEEFKSIKWNEVIEKVIELKPDLFFLKKTLESSSELNIVNIFEDLIRKGDKKIKPLLLEIFTFSVLKSHLTFFGSNIFRWTKINASDGGVDFTCGDTSYCVTTNLNFNKITSDLNKQVNDKIVFVTIDNKKLNIKKINSMYKSKNINILLLKDVIDLYKLFDKIKFKKFKEILSEEIEKEIN